MKNLNIILLIVALAATAGIFFLLGPVEKTCLFYANLSVAVVLEILLFCTLFGVTKRQKYDIQNIALARQVGIYVLLMFIWMAAYSFGLRGELSVNWYYSGLILLTLIYTAIVIFTKQGGDAQRGVHARTSEAVAQARTQNIDTRTLLEELDNSVHGREADAELVARVRKSLGIYCDKVTGIPSLDRVNKPAMMSRVEADQLGIRDSIAAIANAEDIAEALRSTDRITRSAINYIEQNR